MSATSQIEAALRADPARSNRQIARELGCDDRRVGRVREAMVKRRDLPTTLVRVGADGRVRGIPGLKKARKASSAAALPEMSDSQLRDVFQTIVDAATKGKDLKAALWLVEHCVDPTPPPPDGEPEREPDAAPTIFDKLAARREGKRAG